MENRPSKLRRDLNFPRSNGTSYAQSRQAVKSPAILLLDREDITLDITDTKPKVFLRQDSKELAISTRRFKVPHIDARKFATPERRTFRDRLKGTASKIGDLALKTTITTTEGIKHGTETLVRSRKARVAVLGLAAVALGGFVAYRFGTALHEHGSNVAEALPSPATLPTPKPSTTTTLTSVASHIGEHHNSLPTDAATRTAFQAIVDRPDDFHRMVQWGLDNPGQDVSQALNSISRIAA